MAFLLSDSTSFHVFLKRHFTLCWVCILTARGLLLHKSRHAIERHPWKNVTGASDTSDLALDESASGGADTSEFLADVYFMRHGQSTLNKLLDPSNKKEGKLLEKLKSFSPEQLDNPNFWDVGLSDLGVKQCVQAKDVLDGKLGLGEVPPGSIQLASSLNVRAFDSLVIASEPLWRKWVDKGVDFMLHGVPAAMELDSFQPSSRKPGVQTDDPVRWQDSALAKNSANTKTLGAEGLFYETEKEQEQLQTETSKPVQVQSYYERVLADFTQNGCDSTMAAPNLSALMRYLTAQAAAGKKHIVMGSHGALMECMIYKYGSEKTVPTSKGREYNLAKPPENCKSIQCVRTVPNAAILHVRMHRTKHGIALEPKMLYESDAESY